MRAVQFDVSVPGFLLARSLGRVTHWAVHGRGSGLRLRDVPEPSLPGPDWVKLDVLAAGICGTDISSLAFDTSTAMEPFASFPAVPGHEILARVREVGTRVTRVETGQRVVVDPMVSCRVRGYPPDDECPSCTVGWSNTCDRAGEEGPGEIGDRPMGPGLTIGYHRDLPGGWGETLVAHESQLHAVPDDLDDRTAVLVEPLSIGLHAVLANRSRHADPVMVIGSGPIAMGTVWALRATGFRGEVVAQTKRPHEARMAERLGASRIVSPGLEARDALVDTGAMAYQPLVGPEVFSGGGFPLVFDCVGNAASLDQALRFTAPRGRIVMLGCAARIRSIDLTFLWARELEVKGFVGYGREEWRGGTAHTFEVARELLVEGRAPVGELVTHVFPLSEYRTALSAAANHRKSGAVKVLLEP